MRPLALILLLSACVEAAPPAPAVQKIRSLPMPLNVNDAIPGDLDLRAVYYDGSCWAYELGGADYAVYRPDGSRICGAEGRG
jgi:hypothetical protein